MCLRPLWSRPQDSEDARDEASDGGVRRAWKSNLLNGDAHQYMYEARLLVDADNGGYADYSLSAGEMARRHTDCNSDKYLHLR